MRLTESLREYFKEELDAGREDGRAEGLEKGIVKGRAEGLEKGRAEGRAEGLEEGREEEKSAIVQNMKNKGLAFETIAELTGIPLSKVQAF